MLEVAFTITLIIIAFLFYRLYVLFELVVPLLYPISNQPQPRCCTNRFPSHNMSPSFVAFLFNLAIPVTPHLRNPNNNHLHSFIHEWIRDPNTNNRNIPIPALPCQSLMVLRHQCGEIIQILRTISNSDTFNFARLVNRLDLLILQNTPENRSSFNRENIQPREEAPPPYPFPTSNTQTQTPPTNIPPIRPTELQHTDLQFAANKFFLSIPLHGVDAISIHRGFSNPDSQIPMRTIRFSNRHGREQIINFNRIDEINEFPLTFLSEYSRYLRMSVGNRDHTKDPTTIIIERNPDHEIPHYQTTQPYPNPNYDRVSDVHSSPEDEDDD